MEKLSWGKRAIAVFALCAATAIALPAQTFTTLHAFSGADGEYPYAGLVQGADGNFYGATLDGGANGYGTIFKITPGGTLTTLHSFDSTDGRGPNAQLIEGTDGSFYGTTEAGGAYDYGTIFKITYRGVLTTLHSFDATDGYYPNAGLAQGTDGNFYGTTYGGGAIGPGTVFKITPEGVLTTLYSFGGSLRDGAWPMAGLVQGTDGSFYGTTGYGGVDGVGTVFKITADGTVTMLYNFHGTDGSAPVGGLVQASDGKFYGTTEAGGKVCKYPGCGTVFSITSGGALTTLHTFASGDGAYPAATLVQATDGNFYGTTLYGGVNCAPLGGCGTVFKISAAGRLTTLHSFAETDSLLPVAAVVQGTDGIFYGTTSPLAFYGYYGTVYSLAVGLGPFVEIQTTSGKVGAPIKILGTDLTGATSVTFNGTAAVFHVVSSSLISATVPTGATNGKVQVVTPSGTLSSNVPFRVQP